MGVGRHGVEVIRFRLRLGFSSRAAASLETLSLLSKLSASSFVKIETALPLLELS